MLGLAILMGAAFLESSFAAEDVKLTGSDIDAGAAYLYRGVGSDWMETKLVASGIGGNNLCGASVSISNDRIAVGSQWASNFTGAMYSFDRSPTITWSNPGAITHGTALSGTQLNATSSVAGSFSCSPASGTVLDAGTHTLTVNFTPTDTARYANASATVSLTVNKATPIIDWSAPAPITYGVALGGT